MASRGNKKTTMAKLARERNLQERRERKQLRKEERKREAAAPPVAGGDSQPDRPLEGPEPTQG